jgi:hypothetical protein
MPTPQQTFLIVLDQLLYAVDFIPAEAAAVLKPDGFEPELGLVSITLDVDVRRFVRVASIKEESVGPKPQHGWHQFHLAPA